MQSPLIHIWDSLLLRELVLYSTSSNLMFCNLLTLNLGQSIDHSTYHAY